MEQIKSIVREVYSGLVTNSDKIADLVTRTPREYAVFDYAQKSSMLLCLEDGGPETQQDYSSLPDDYSRYFTHLNSHGKKVVCLLIVTKEIQGARIQQIWSASPAATVASFALGLRIWGAFLDAHPSFVSVISMLSKYGAVNEPAVKDDLTVYACSSAVSALPYQNDVRIVSFSDEDGVGLLAVLADKDHHEGRQSVIRIHRVMHDANPAGLDMQTALRGLRHPAAFIHEKNNNTEQLVEFAKNFNRNSKP